MKRICICTLAIAMFLLGSHTFAEKANVKGSNSFRIIPIPKRENGYSRFDTTVITSKSNFDSFLKKIFADKIGWNDRKNFEATLKKAEIDFSTEAIVFLRHTEGSGSIEVTFEAPVLESNKLLVNIKRHVPEVQTTDMAYYCFAIVVDKASVKEIELGVDKGKKITLHIIAEEPVKPAGPPDTK